VPLSRSKMASGLPVKKSDTPLKAWVRALELTAPGSAGMALPFPCHLEKLAATIGNAPALLAPRRDMSFGNLVARANQYARLAHALSLVAGDVVCLMAANSPEYVAIWSGLTRVGVVVALINTNLSGDALAHCVNIVKPRCLILGAAFAKVVEDVKPLLMPSIPCFSYEEAGSAFPNLSATLDETSAARLPADEFPVPALEHNALYIYTSGTTGLPKAAIVSHYRLIRWCLWFAGMLDIKASDRMYNCLPMYHSIGGVVAVGAALASGASVFVREGFSASRFWDEVCDNNCTLFQYIGELCRYLVNSPANPREKNHSLRLACGNGMRRDVWESFQERFEIPRVIEFYAATEANFSLYNCEGEPGSIGRIPPFLAHRFPVALVRFDPVSGQPMRGLDGLCQRCAPDEIGEAIAPIANAEGEGAYRFEGYSDEKATRSKVLRDVFAPGDAWFRSGDLMRRDKRGFFYFVDRVGDTFRWKGENVSTAEVAEAIGTFPSVLDAVVYGVAVPGTEGRAGMAAIVVGPDFDLAKFHEFVAHRLPQYARPLFVRLINAIEVTGTFKAKKQDLAREGYDLTLVTDPIYFNDRASARFLPLDSELGRRLAGGHVSL